jgi:phage-related protein
VKINTLVLLHAYHKKTQQTPNKEIAIAEKRLDEVKENEKNHA